jgi:hypothetical protein
VLDQRRPPIMAAWVLIEWAGMRLPRMHTVRYISLFW